MRTYVYGCEEKEHPKVEVVHEMGANPDVWCGTCHKKMHRVPQPFKWGWHPVYAMFDHMDRRYEEWRRKQK